MTNYKVMSSSLKAQPLLDYIDPWVAFPKLFQSRVNSKGALDLYFLVRNPYEKIVSFYIEKFTRRPRNQMANPQLTWQDCQKIFFYELGIHGSTSEKEKRDRFLHTSFSEFMAMVRRVYRRDLHLHPQSWLQWARIKGIPLFQLNISRIIRIDTKDISFLSDELQLDMTIKKNPTDHPPYSEIFTGPDYAIMNSVYGADFEKFGYAKY